MIIFGRWLPKSRQHDFIPLYSNLKWYTFYIKEKDKIEINEAEIWMTNL